MLGHEQGPESPVSGTNCPLGGENAGALWSSYRYPHRDGWRYADNTR